MAQAYVRLREVARAGAVVADDGAEAAGVDDGLRIYNTEVFWVFYPSSGHRHPCCPRSSPGSSLWVYLVRTRCFAVLCHTEIASLQKLGITRLV